MNLGKLGYIPAGHGVCVCVWRHRTEFGHEKVYTEAMHACDKSICRNVHNTKPARKSVRDNKNYTRSKNLDVK
jgi:hypothetical protein